MHSECLNEHLFLSLLAIRTIIIFCGRTGLYPRSTQRHICDLSIIYRHCGTGLRSIGSHADAGGVVRLVKTLFVAAVSLTTLSACVGADPQARLRAGSSSSLATAAPVELDLIEPTRPLAAVMPGDLLPEPKRRAASINPESVLTRPNKRIAYSTAAPPRRAVAHAAHITEVPAPVETERSDALTQTSPFLAARLGPAEVRARTSLAVKPALTPPMDVEARAEVEQQAQAIRNRRFDAQVRRASSMVCSGCGPTTGRKPARIESSVNETDD